MRRFALACCLLGCDSLAGKDYVGEPLFTLTGSFASSTVAPQEPVGGLALMWQDPVGAGGPGIAATAVPVAIQFPATFKVDVPTPPPDEVRFAFADNPSIQLGEAYVYVVIDPSATRLVPAGADRTHVLVYATADVPAGSLAADYLGGPMTAGYHLRKFTASAPGTAQAQMIARCTGTVGACKARRGYQLQPIDDADPLRIAVSPP